VLFRGGGQGRAHACLLPHMAAIPVGGTSALQQWLQHEVACVLHSLPSPLLVCRMLTLPGLLLSLLLSLCSAAPVSLLPPPLPTITPPVPTHRPPLLRPPQRLPERIIEHAVKGMLPKGRLGRKIRLHLKVYKGEQHPHVAQQPVDITADIVSKRRSIPIQK